MDLSSIKQLRTKLGMSQAEVAKMAGVTQAHIAKIETGKVDPRFSTVQKIFRSLEEKQKVSCDKYMTLKIIGVRINDTIEGAAKIMKQNNISQLPVFMGQKIVGTLTEKDILKHSGGEEFLMVKDVMGDAPPYISRKTSIDTVKELLIEFPAVIVTDMGKVVGIITRSDLLRS